MRSITCAGIAVVGLAGLWATQGAAQEPAGSILQNLAQMLRSALPGSPAAPPLIVPLNLVHQVGGKASASCTSLIDCSQDYDGGDVTVLAYTTAKVPATLELTIRADGWCEGHPSAATWFAHEMTLLDTNVTKAAPAIPFTTARFEYRPGTAKGFAQGVYAVLKPADLGQLFSRDCVVRLPGSNIDLAGKFVAGTLTFTATVTADGDSDGRTKSFVLQFVDSGYVFRF